MERRVGLIIVAFRPCVGLKQKGQYRNRRGEGEGGDHEEPALCTTALLIEEVVDGGRKL